MFYQKKLHESEDKPPCVEHKEYSGLSLSSGPVYRSLQFEAFSAPSESLSSSLPFEPKYRSLDFAPHHEGFHSLNQEADRALGGGGVDLSMPSFHTASPANPLNPKANSNDWNSDADFQVPSLQKGMKSLPPVAMGPSNQQVYRPQKSVSLLQQSLDLVASAPAPTELPSQFEMFSSFWSASSPLEIWPVTIKSLQSNPKVDYVFQAKRNKIKGSIVLNNYSVQFNVRIFAKPSKDSSKWNAKAKHLVEIQRRSGDAFEFSAFYKQTVEAICKLDKNVFLSEASPMVQPALQLPNISGVPVSLAPPTLSTKQEVSLDVDTRRALYSMAVATQNTEAQREALRTLASISNSVNATSFLTNQDRDDGLGKLSLSPPDEEITLEQVLQCALTSRDHEVRRCASTLLANISRQESAQPIMSATLIQKMFALLEQEHLDSDVSDKHEAKPLPDYMAAETKRQIAKAIHGLSAIPSSCKIMASQPDYVRLLRQQSEVIGDPRLSIYAESAVARMAPQLGARAIFV